MLGFREFKDEFISSCRSSIASFTDCFDCGDIEIEERSVTKAQRGSLSGLIFRAPGTIAAPTYYVEDFYKMYRSGASIGDLSFEIAKNAFHFIHETPVFPSIATTASFEDPSNLRVRLINSLRNSELLKNVPYRDTGCGLALIPEVRSGEFRAVVTNELMKSFGMSADEILDRSLENAASYDPAVLADLTDVLSVGQDNCKNLLEGPLSPVLPAPGSLCVLSNKSFCWGASALFYDGMASRLSGLLGGDFYVLPSSVHEVLILPEAVGDPEKLIETIHEGNRTVVSDEEFLSDDLIICESGRLRIFDPQ